MLAIRMNAAWVCVVGLGVFALGYRCYSRWLARRVFRLRPDEPVPARELEDGVDYVPTSKHVLFGHHYASIAGAAPIIGPAIAVVWGWVPAVLWVIFGTVFMGAVHDFATLVLSVRHRGRSVGSITSQVISPRARTLFLLIVFCLVTLVIAVFAIAIAKLFMVYPGAVVPIHFEIVVAIAIGYIAYRRRRSLLLPSILALVALYFMVWVGHRVPIELDFGSQTRNVWIVGLLGYAFVASVLPVWLLLQPRDFINSHQLAVGLGGLILGLLVAQPEITAPAFHNPGDARAWFPFLFVTIACGAISGFHGLVSSGTTSKQISSATDARFIGYGAMLGEGTLALVATLAVSAGLADWSAHYSSWQVVQTGAVVNFVEGASTFLRALAVPGDVAAVVVAVIVISFAATTLDTGVRIQRHILQEIGEAYGVRALVNRYVAGLVAVAFPAVLIFGKQAGGLWRLFGATNQLLAGLSLTVVTVWMHRQRMAWWYTAVPMVIVLALSATAMVTDIGELADTGRYMLASIATVILALNIWVILEGVFAIQRHRRLVD